jgi:hypothetical protein
MMYSDVLQWTIIRLSLRRPAESWRSLQVRLRLRAAPGRIGRSGRPDAVTLVLRCAQGHRPGDWGPDMTERPDW